VNTNDNTKQNPRCLLRVRAKNTGVEISRMHLYDTVQIINKIEKKSELCLTHAWCTMRPVYVQSCPYHERAL